MWCSVIGTRLFCLSAALKTFPPIGMISVWIILLMCLPDTPVHLHDDWLTNNEREVKCRNLQRQDQWGVYNIHNYQHQAVLLCLRHQHKATHLQREKFHLLLPLLLLSTFSVHQAAQFSPHAPQQSHAMAPVEHIFCYLKETQGWLLCWCRLCWGVCCQKRSQSHFNQVSNWVVCYFCTVGVRSFGSPRRRLMWHCWRWKPSMWHCPNLWVIWFQFASFCSKSWQLSSRLHLLLHSIPSKRPSKTSRTGLSQHQISSSPLTTLTNMLFFEVC